MTLDDITQDDFICVTLKSGREHKGRFDGYRKLKDKTYVLALQVSDVGSGAFSFLQTSLIQTVERLAAPKTKRPPSW